MPYVQLQQFLDEEYPRGRHYYWKSAAAGRAQRRGDRRRRRVRGVAAVAAQHDRRLGHGRRHLREEPPGGSAYSGRSAGYLVNPEADWDDGADDEANIAWARQLIKALEPYTVGNYLNFPGLLEEGEEQLRASFGAHYERLVEVKTRWDPDNVFRLNHNVPPRRRKRRRRRSSSSTGRE